MTDSIHSLQLDSWEPSSPRQASSENYNKIEQRSKQKEPEYLSLIAVKWQLCPLQGQKLQIKFSLPYILV